MLESPHGLTDSELEAIACLERRVVAADGGRLKLEWSTLRSRPAGGPHDLLWWERGKLLGFLGIYGSNRDHLEVTGMVEPDARRRGIGGRLFKAALPICRAQNRERLLMVVPRNAAGGREFAMANGMTHEHSEHALVLRQRPASARTDGIGLRPATPEDIPALSRLYDDGFHDGGHVDPSRLATAHSRTLMIVREGAILGTIAVSRDGARSAVHGFVVDSALRRRGIGGAALRRVCQDQFDAGAERVELEVEVDNDRALGLYASIGFELQATDDYYELSL